jgi:hypothetical protein
VSAEHEHLAADFAERVRRVVPQIAPAVPETPVEFIDWTEFWSKDRSEPEWALERILARGRGHALYAKRKAGKSLLMLWCALELIKSGILVLYFDYEMTEDDIEERLADLGCGAETDLSLLRYALLPVLPALDSAEGGRRILEIVDREMTGHVGRHTAVIIDTIGRATQGDENDADTIQDFYRHTGIGLKRRGCTWARLDHEGKDGERGQRGSSAKGDDVDVVWRLVATEGGVELRRDVARMSWVPEKVCLRQQVEPVLCYHVEDDSWPAGTVAAAEALDRLGIALDASRRTASKALSEDGSGARTQVVAAALRWRRMMAPENREPG